MVEKWIVWPRPGDVVGPDSALLGGKGANLLALSAACLPVPAGFCLTTAAYRAFLAHNGLKPTSSPSDLVAILQAGTFPPWLAQAIIAAGEELSAGEHRLAVRSSATMEDLAAASFAGQGESVLDVPGDEGDALLAAVRRCWASLWSGRAQSYRPAAGAETPLMAVVVQQMIPCDLAGIAFTVDPLDGTPAVVIEAVRGLADRLAAGEVAGERYRLERPGLLPLAAHRGALLAAEQLRQIATLALAAEQHFGSPQDVEWGLQGNTTFLFQSRPITVHGSGFFTERLSADDHFWTGGFFNERFPRPVSPLGWTLLRELLVPLALANPLRYLGVRPAEMPPLVKLYRGHPYANVAAFQMLYAAFPDWLLPVDAYRFFPAGAVALRRQVAYPRAIWHPRTFFALASAFLRQPAAASPWHNWRAWGRFERRHECSLAQLQAELEALPRADRPAAALWSLHRRAQSLNRQLLKLHRWSLTLADLTYTLLRRLVRSAVGSLMGDGLAAELVTGLPSHSVRLDWAVAKLAAGEMGLDAFLAQFGHRSFDLDIAHPTFADDPGQVLELVERLRQGDHPGLDRRPRERPAAQGRAEAGLKRWQRPLFRHLLGLARTYMRLREDQRFIWQRTLAFQRRVLLALGEFWLDRPEAIFGATLDEVRQAASGERPLPQESIAERCAELHKLEAEHRLAPAWTYPPFLRGDRPLDTDDSPAGNRWQGLPVSPGVGRGPARVVLSPDQFGRVRPGDVLITRGADPGWTPLFGLLAGLILETGGQLSHGAVVAREYGLPAVAALSGITGRLQDGQMVTLDGRTGQVLVEPDLPAR